MAQYATGLVIPSDIAERHRASWNRYGRFLKALPHVTADSWDCRKLGIVGPIKDQGQCGCMPGTDEVLTSDGWKKWEDYNWVTPVGTMNPINGLLEFQSPIQQHIYEYDGEMYYSDNRSVDFALTPNHRMYVRKWNESKRKLDDNYKFTEISKIGWYAGLPHATTGFIGTELKKVGIGKREYDGDDFLAIIALVTSDGWTGGSESTKNTVSFCCFRDDRIDMVKKLAQKLEIKESPSRPGVWILTDGDLAEWFRVNAYTSNIYRSPFKRIPNLVKVASSRQISHFLKFFGDQYIDNETRRFYSSSKLIIDDLQELLLRIGKRGTLSERSPRTATMKDGRNIKTDRPSFELTERRTERLSLERKRNVKVDHYKGKVYCATVPNSILITRRNGSILVSGNSCWDFSGTGIVEMAMVKAGLGPPESFQLSEQYTLDCGQNGGCNGDDNSTVCEWAKKTGLPLTSDYGPYQGSAERCKSSSSLKLYKITDWGYCSSSQGVADTQAIKNAMVSYGPIGAAIAADNAFMNNPPGTVFDGNSQDINHDIILAGWDDSKGAWLLRNSWGMGWCDQGYCWIKYGANEVGTSALWVTMPSQTVSWYI